VRPGSPNLFKTVAHSPAVLHCFLGGCEALGSGALNAGLREQIALVTAGATVRERGCVNDAQLQSVRSAGFGDAEVVEIVANVVANIFTNYFNHVAGTAIDFPVVSANANAPAHAWTAYAHSPPS
jgi:alkylhydroperoxidase family enzyme